MFPDETCWLLAVDLDGDAWQQDARAFRETCKRLSLPITLERSRSGNGGHFWLFFSEPIPATLARNVGSHLLTETMESRPEIGLASYDRLFPNQDTLPKGGFGNLIALPLQKRPREAGNSVFLDDEFNPYSDQWAFLSSVRRIVRAQAESLARDAQRRNRITGVQLPIDEQEEDMPWKSPPSRIRKDPPIDGPLPKSLELVLADQVYVPKEHLSPGLHNRLVRLAAFQNPEFYQAQQMRLATFGIPRIIHCDPVLPDRVKGIRSCGGQNRVSLSYLYGPTPLHEIVFSGTQTGSPSRFAPQHSLFMLHTNLYHSASSGVHSVEHIGSRSILNTASSVTSRIMPCLTSTISWFASSSVIVLGASVMTMQAPNGT